MAPARQSQSWHKLYYVLAAIDLVTLSGGLWLSHQMLTLYRGSLSGSQALVVLANELEELASLVGDVNAPGNNVFDSRDPARERPRMEAAHKAYEHQLEKVIVDSTTPVIDSKLFSEGVKAVQVAMGRMVEEARTIFEHFDRGEVAKAGSRMATMDQKFAVLNRELAGLRSIVRDAQSVLIARQVSRAESLRGAEIGFGLVVVLIVMLVTWYGRLLASRVRTTDELISAQRAQIASSYKLASLGIMAAGIAHEVNNPLTVIMAAAERLKRDQDGAEPSVRAALVDKIQATVDRISKIIRGLRTFARNGESDPFSPERLDDVVAEATSIVVNRLRKAGVELIQNHFEPVVLSCRRVQVEQVLVNLLSNAADANEGRSGSWVRVELRGDHEFLDVVVTDSGDGILPETAEKILTPFFTTKEVGKGTGLGLSISYGIMKDHDGDLFYDANHPHTRFVMRFPRSRVVKLAA